MRESVKDTFQDLQREREKIELDYNALYFVSERWERLLARFQQLVPIFGLNQTIKDLSTVSNQMKRIDKKLKIAKANYKRQSTYSDPNQELQELLGATLKIGLLDRFPIQESETYEVNVMHMFNEGHPVVSEDGGEWLYIIEAAVSNGQGADLAPELKAFDIDPIGEKTNSGLFRFHLIWNSQKEMFTRMEIKVI
jgi:hypothetical protein